MLYRVVPTIYSVLSVVPFFFALVTAPSVVLAQGFPNVPRTPGELIVGPIAPEQGRTAIVAWHGERIVSVPEIPGSQGGADYLVRVVDISNPLSPQVTIVPTRATGFHAHGYFQSGAHLYIGPYCLTNALQACVGNNGNWNDSFRIGGAGTAIGTSQLRAASMEGDRGLMIGGIDRSGAQSPWGVRDFWTYNSIEGNTFLAVRRLPGEYIYDWANGGTPNGPAIKSSWDHLSLTGVSGFPFIMGNILIFASDQAGSGVAAYDISDLSAPVLLDVLKEENPGGYWPEVYGHYIFFPRRDAEGGVGSSAGFMVVDFSDPTNLRVVANRNLPGSNQYVTFQDEFAFMNRYKIDMRTFEVELTLPTGLQPDGVTRIDASQFSLPVGNLVVTGGYGTDGPGLAVWAHQAAPDTRSPYVLYHVPTPDQTNYSVDCPITLSIPETLRTETIVDGASLIVRPLGGSPIPIWHSFGQGKLLTVTPRQPLLPNTTYEVLLTNAIQDAAGNGLEPYTFRFSTGSNLAGGNMPPVVGPIVVTPETGLPTQELTITWAGSDPDGGVIEYRADFGDGSPRTAWGTGVMALHTYATEGHYQVTVQARDSLGAVSARSRTITVVASPTAPGSVASSLMALDTAANLLYVANPDSDSVTAINTTSLQVIWEDGTGRHPQGLASASDNSLWIVCRDEDSIDIRNADGSFGRLQLPYGSAPVAIARIPGTDTMLVSCEGDGVLRRFSTATRQQTGSLALGPWPRAIAITANGTRALVTRFISSEHTGHMYDVNLAGGMSLTRTIALARDRSADGSASSRGVPNYLASVRIAPDGRWAWVVGKKDNTTRGRFFAREVLGQDEDDLALGQDSTVRAQLMLIDLTTNAEDLTRRLDIDNSESPAAVEFSPLGDYAFIALQGNAQIAVIDVLDFMRQDSPGTVRARWATGLAPQAVLLDAANGRLFSSNFMGRSVTAFDVGGFLASGAANIASQAITVVAAERLAEPVLRGKQIFYHASDPRMSAEGYISCATCHVNGGHDGRTFDFTDRGEGFRNTTDLRGRSGVGHGAVHWSANFDEIQDFENDIRNEFGGAGFLSDEDFALTSDTLGAPKANRNVDLDALAAYVTSLGSASIPRSPYRNVDGSMTEAATRGEQLFAMHNCGTCHTPSADFTDRLSHDVGTLRASSGQRLGATLNAIDTPTLLGVHATAPYFHDGSAATLAEVFTVAGGQLLQAEAGTLANGAYVDEVSWHPLKEWHRAGFVELDGARSITYSNIASSQAGAGFVEVRYSSQYAATQLRVTVNGAATNTNLPMLPNQPSWLPNEWRRARVAVNFIAGANTVVLTEGNLGGTLLIDDVLITTPDHLAASSAHVRGFNAGETADMVAYLRSLDGSNAAAPMITVERGQVIASGGTDTVEVPPQADVHVLVYTISNGGTGPLNLGQFHVSGASSDEVWIERQPAPNVPPGASTELELRIDLATESTSAVIQGWTDSPPVSDVLWTVEATRASSSGVGNAWINY